MKKKFIRWFIYLTIAATLLFGILIWAMFTPSLFYSQKTNIAKHTIYHNTPLDPHFKTRLYEALALIQKSEFYNKNIRLDICLSDQANIQWLLTKLRGLAFGWGYSNKIVLNGKTNYKNNTTEINGYKWNFSQLLAHEATHCLQMLKLGLWNSSPIANHPHWKWEGYPEYIARRNAGQLNLVKNIQRKITTDRTQKSAWGVLFDDGTAVSKEYYNDWLLMQYCINIKHMKYKEILGNKKLDKSTIQKQMMQWFAKQQKLYKN